ncbi:hypothetical protein, partial [uncultured Bacteroides sp.]|uniref:hypothetical protein n=1 Tax=uncultured Bacteroides sp. TaxID=162156 RepID=UPI00280B4D85
QLSQELILKLTTIFSTPQTLWRLFLNASTFQTKRLCVLIQTQVRFTQNVRAFKPKRKGVF